MKISIALLILEMSDTVRRAIDSIKHAESIEKVVGRVNWTRGLINSIEVIINVTDLSDREQDELEFARWTMLRELISEAGDAIVKHRDSITPEKLQEYMSKVHVQMDEANDELEALKEEL